MYLPVWKLFQKRRSSNRRNMVAELRILLKPANLNNAFARTPKYFVQTEQRDGYD